MRDNENIMQETSFSSVGKNHKILTANLTRPQIKIPLPEDLKDLEITELQTKQGFHLAFGHNYTNYFDSILKKYNNMCSFRFTRNFIRREDSRKRRAPKFTVEAQCQMKDCPVKATIQQLVNRNNTFEDFLTITFRGNIFHQPGDFQSRRIIDEEKKDLYKAFQKNLNLKPSNVYKDKLGEMHDDQYTYFNRTGTGNNVSTFQNIASRARKEIANIKNINEEVLSLQSEYEKIDKEKYNYYNRKNFGYVHQPSISSSGLYIYLFDEPIVRFYHNIATVESFYLDATGTLLSEIPSIQNDNGNPKRILLYALTMRHAHKNVPPIAIIEYITTNHNIFSIRQPLMKLRELEFQIFRQNATPQLIVTDYSKAIIQAVLLEFNKESLHEYLNRTFRITEKINQQDITNSSTKITLHICSYHVLKMNFEKLKKCTKKNSIIHFCQRLLGRLICFENLGDITKFAVHCLKVLTNPDVTSEAEQSLKIINEEINSFSNFEGQISLENGDLSNISHDDSSFSDVIDADSCWRSYWQQVVTHE